MSNEGRKCRKTATDDSACYLCNTIVLQVSFSQTDTFGAHPLGKQGNNEGRNKRDLPDETGRIIDPGKIQNTFNFRMFPSKFHKTGDTEHTTAIKY